MLVLKVFIKLLRVSVLKIKLHYWYSFAAGQSTDSTADLAAAGMTLATAAAGHSLPVSPPAKISRGDYLCQFEDDADATPVMPDEVSSYLQTRVLTSEYILHWWRVNSSSYCNCSQGDSANSGF